MSMVVCKGFPHLLFQRPDTLWRGCARVLQPLGCPQAFAVAHIVVVNSLVRVSYIFCQAS